jgi:hypothetical protein
LGQARALTRVAKERGCVHTDIIPDRVSIAVNAASRHPNNVDDLTAGRGHVTSLEHGREILIDQR